MRKGGGGGIAEKHWQLFGLDHIVDSILSRVLIITYVIVSVRLPRRSVTLALPTLPKASAGSRNIS